ncbi:MAG: PspC domain-containing protein [Anaerolineales bacterium]|jgi:phage shock protein PspC (stress-responsive transcriptional regulator)
MTNSRRALRRSRRNRIVGGVCGGLAEFFGISSFWFRLAFLILLIPGGLPGLLPYIIMWIIIPSE